MSVTFDHLKVSLVIACITKNSKKQFLIYEAILKVTNLSS